MADDNGARWVAGGAEAVVQAVKDAIDRVPVGAQLAAIRVQLAFIRPERPHRLEAGGATITREGVPPADVSRLFFLHAEHCLQVAGGLPGPPPVPAEGVLAHRAPRRARR